MRNKILIIRLLSTYKHCHCGGMRVYNMRIIGDNIGADVPETIFALHLLVLLRQMQMRGFRADDMKEGLHPAGAAFNGGPVQTGTTQGSFAKERK